MATFSVNTPYGGGSGWDPFGSFGESFMDSWFADAAAENAFDRQKELAELNYQNNLRALRESPAAAREGLVSAGYNPILAVNSAAGSSFSNSVPGSSMAQLHGSHSQAQSNFNNAVAAQIKKTNAETNLLERRALGEGWVVKTLTAHEARGLGANFARTLGLSFNGSDSQTFLVAYNTITGEMRNIADTESLGSTGETTDAASVRAQFDNDSPITFHYRSGEDQPYKATYDHTHKPNLPR